MPVLTFKSKQEFLNFVNAENEPKQPETPKAAPVGLTQEQIRKNSHEYQANYWRSNESKQQRGRLHQRKGRM